jgi:PKD repeat protein
MYPSLSISISPIVCIRKHFARIRFLLILLTALPSYTFATNECTADFDYFQAPSGWLDIQFINHSTGPIGYYVWDFGDGFQSNEINPVHSYQNPGTYLVCLTVSSPTKDCYDVKCVEITIPLPFNCYTPFSIDTVANNPFHYQFTAFPPPDVDSLLWDFGDGTIGRGITISHIYADTGRYIVSLTAYNYHNPYGCYSVVTDTVEIFFEPCISAFMMYAPSYNPLQVKFIPVCTGNINNYFWDFGDGKTSFEVSPVHKYTDTGTYQVCLTVANSAWPQYCNDTLCQWLQIKLDRCQANFTFEQNPDYPLKFKFTNTSIGILNQFFWDFGDGDTSLAAEPVHSFPSPGDYPVKLRVSNFNFPEVCSDSIVKIVSTGDLSCSASFWWITDSLRPTDVSFHAEITGIPDFVQWDFGDGFSSWELNPIHSFPDTGTYLVKLIVFNSAYQSFCNDTAQAFLHLKINHKPRADFEFYLDSLSLQPNLFRFKDLSQGFKVTQWYWTFGDGGTSVEQNPVHAFAAAQSYQVCLKVYDHLPPNFVITDKVCKSLTGRNYYNLGGSIYAGEFPINNPTPQNDTALVYLYRVSKGTSITQARSGRFSKLGYYWFSDVIEGEYLVKAVLSEGSNHYKQYFPTWGISALTWYSADPITMNRNIFDADIHLIRKNLSGSGPGMAAGRVVVLEETPFFQMIPASEVIVFLKNSTGLFLDYTFSDSLGQFNFNHLPLATYLIESEYPGLLCLSDTAQLTVATPVVKDLLVKLYSNHSLSIPEDIEKESIKLYPNPAESTVVLQWFSSKAQQTEIAIHGIDGRLVRKHLLQAKAGENTWEFDISQLKSGVYIIQVVESSLEPIITKFIKQ